MFVVWLYIFKLNDIALYLNKIINRFKGCKIAFDSRINIWGKQEALYASYVIG